MSILPSKKYTSSKCGTYCSESHTHLLTSRLVILPIDSESLGEDWWIYKLPIILELIYFYCLFFTIVTFNSCVFFPVGLSSLTRHSQQILLSIEVSPVCWLGQEILPWYLKALILIIVWLSHIIIFRYFFLIYLKFTCIMCSELYIVSIVLVIIW